MARRRMIEVSIAHDKAFNKLSVFSQLLFLKILPHTDDYGRFEGDPEIVKARVDPLSDKKLDAYTEAMKEIATSGLWVWYELPDGKMVVQYKQDAFERINAFLIKKRGNPEYPAYSNEYKLISSDIHGISHIKYKEESIKYKEEGVKKKDAKPENVDAVKVYFREIGMNLADAEQFYDYYATNGWVQGKAQKPIKDWKAAARNWKRHKIQYSTPTGRAIEPQPMDTTILTKRITVVSCPHCYLEDIPEDQFNAHLEGCDKYKETPKSDKILTNLLNPRGRTGGIRSIGETLK